MVLMLVATFGIRHDRAGGNGHKAGHRRVFDQVLTTGLLTDPQPLL